MNMFENINTEEAPEDMPMNLSAVKHVATGMYFVSMEAEVPFPPAFVMSSNMFNAWFFPEKEEAEHVRGMLGEGWIITETSQVFMSPDMRKMLGGSFDRPFQPKTRADRRREKRGR